MRHRLLLLFLLMLVPCAMMAQDLMTVQGKVTILNETTDKEIKGVVYYSEMRTKEQANAAVAEYKRLIASDGNSDKKLDEFQRRYKILRRNKVARNGRFEFETMPGWHHIFLLPELEEIRTIDIVAGKTEYDLLVKVKQEREVEKLGTSKNNGIDIESDNVDVGDGMVSFNISITIPQELSREDSRLIIQPVAVNCMTDDTVGYCTPIVMESERYHKLQDKRKNYNYAQFDSLSRGFLDKPIHPGEDIVVKKSVIYKKPDKKAHYRGPWKLALEDYHHVYYRHSDNGTCLVKQPFKFVDLSPAVAEIELTDEFREEEGINKMQESQKLPVRFVVGKDEIVQDSANIEMVKRLAETLNMYGDMLISLSINSYSSPDGNYETNKSLAQRRAQRAASMVQSYLSKKRNITPKSDVKTWDEVVEKLKAKGLVAQADSVVQIITNNKKPDAQLKALPFYESYITPILEGMRVMEVNYEVLIEKKYTPKEAVDEFRHHRAERIAGKTKPFSNGDYWNIFNNLTDSAEIDTLTVMAYNHITKRPDYEIDNIIAPYVCNRMAILNLRKGTPNVRILEPFIDLSVHKVNAKKGIQGTFETRTINRKEMLINQAVAYYMEMKNDTARFYVKWLHDCKVTDPALDALERIINLRTLHSKAQKTDEEKVAYNVAKNYVLNISDENKAILYTEIPNWDDNEDAMRYIDMMSDESAKKWYLKGIWWARQTKEKPYYRKENRYGKENIILNEPRREDLDDSEDSGTEKISIGGGLFLLSAKEVDKLSGEDYLKYDYQLSVFKDSLEKAGQSMPVLKEKPKAADADVEYDYVPYYLAYFNHAFELEPDFKRMYFSEGHVTEDMRKMFKYKKKDIPAYRKLFRLLQKDEEKQLKEEVDDKNEDKKEQVEKNNEATPTDTAAM